MATVAESQAGTAGTITNGTAIHPSPQANNISLWEGLNIPYIRISGEVGSGKTLFMLLSDPNCLKKDVPPTTIIWDLEGSSTTYHGQLNFERRDLGKMLKDKYPNGYKAVDVFLTWIADLKTIPEGKYNFGCVDTFTEIETGITDFLRANPKLFNRTPNQYEKAPQMFLWPDAKAYAKQIINSQISPRFKTFQTAHHLKNKWDSGRPTGERISEGLDILEKLCSLHLELDRTPKSKGKEAPSVPSAIVKKQRLILFGESDDDGKPILPPRLPKATASAIRAYIKNPPDFHALKPEERLPDDPGLSDDEKLLISKSIADANLEAEQIKKAALEAAAAHYGQQAAQPPVTSPAPTTTPVVVAPAGRTDSTSTEPATDKPATSENGKDVSASPQANVELCPREVAVVIAQSVDMDQLRAILNAEHGGKKLTELPLATAEAIRQRLSMAKVADQSPGTSNPPENSSSWAERYQKTREEMLKENGGKATPDQLATVRKFRDVKMDLTDEVLFKIAQFFGQDSLKKITIYEMDEVISKLRSCETGLPSGYPANEIDKILEVVPF